MRFFIIATLAATAFITAMAIDVTDANAVVYCKIVGVPKGCVARGAPVCRYAYVNGLPERRCV